MYGHATCIQFLLTVIVSLFEILSALCVASVEVYSPRNEDVAFGISCTLSEQDFTQLMFWPVFWRGQMISALDINVLPCSGFRRAYHLYLWLC